MGKKAERWFKMFQEVEQERKKLKEENSTLRIRLKEIYNTTRK